jgi:hypothetical protein
LKAVLDYLLADTFILEKVEVRANRK